MYYSREDLIKELQSVEDITIINSPLEQNQEGIAYEWKNSTFMLLSSNEKDTPDNSSDDHKLDSVFGLYYVYRPTDIMTDISTLNKYRIANFVTTNSKNIASVTYRESTDSFQISAKYNPILENLQRFKSLVSQDNNKSIRYIIFFLMTMCFDMSATLARLVASYLEDSEKQIELMKDR